MICSILFSWPRMHYSLIGLVSFQRLRSSWEQIVFRVDCRPPQLLLFGSEIPEVIVQVFFLIFTDRSQSDRLHTICGLVLIWLNKDPRMWTVGHQPRSLNLFVLFPSGRVWETNPSTAPEEIDGYGDPDNDREMFQVLQQGLWGGGIYLRLRVRLQPLQERVWDEESKLRQTHPSGTISRQNKDLASTSKYFDQSHKARQSQRSGESSQ